MVIGGEREGARARVEIIDCAGRRGPLRRELRSRAAQVAHRIHDRPDQDATAIEPRLSSSDETGAMPLPILDRLLHAAVNCIGRSSVEDNSIASVPGGSHLSLFRALLQHVR